MSDKMTREQLEARVIAKAWKDDNFRAELLTDAKKAIQTGMSDLGGSIAKLDIQVLEEGPTKIYIVLPPQQPKAASEELSEDDLENVAGGGGSTTSWRCAPFTEAGCVAP